MISVPFLPVIVILPSEVTSVVPPIVPLKLPLVISPVTFPSDTN